MDIVYAALLFTLAVIGSRASCGHHLLTQIIGSVFIMTSLFFLLDTPRLLAPGVSATGYLATWMAGFSVGVIWGVLSQAQHRS